MSITRTKLATSPAMIETTLDCESPPLAVGVVVALTIMEDIKSEESKTERETQTKREELTIYVVVHFNGRGLAIFSIAAYTGWGSLVYLTREGLSLFISKSVQLIGV